MQKRLQHQFATVLWTETANENKKNSSITILEFFYFNSFFA